MLWLSACEMGGSDFPVLICPPAVEYSSTTLNRAATEIDTLPADAVLTRMLSDYAVLRAQIRACEPMPD